MEARRGGAGHLGQRGVEDVGGARQLCGAELGGLQGHPVELVLRHAAEHGRCARGGGRRDDDQVTHALEQVLDETPRVLPGLDDPVDRVERGGRVARGDRIDGLVEQGRVGVAEQRDGALVFHGVPVGAGHQLVEQGQGVTGRSAAGAHDERQHPGRDRHGLALTEGLHVFEHRPGRHQPERVVVRARTDGADHLFGLRRREDELDVLRRLFDDLEQRVEALRRDHVRLVEDEDLVAVAGRREDGALTDVPGVVDAVVAGRVDLDHVERAAAVAGQLDAARADAARGVGRALGAVQAAGEDAGGRRLAAAAGAAEQVGVIHPIRAQRSHQGFGHLGLADHLGKGLWPVAAIQGGNHGSIVVGATDSPPRPVDGPGAASVATGRPRAHRAHRAHPVGDGDSRDTPLPRATDAAGREKLHPRGMRRRGPTPRAEGPRQPAARHPPTALAERRFSRIARVPPRPATAGGP